MRRIYLLGAVLVVLLATSSAVMAAGGRTFTTALTGEAEVTAAGVPNQGDLDGTGSASITLNQGRGEVCYSITVDSIAQATAAHIHAAPENTTGPVVVPLDPPSTGTSTGCVAVATDLIKAIRRNPENYYVNVHNAEYPAGALRGQLG